MSPSSEILTLARMAQEGLSAVFRFRASTGLDIEQVLIYVALGSMNLEASPDNVTTLQPVTIATLCQSIELPRETVRRKLLQLEEQKYVKRSAAGFFIEDLQRWSELAARFARS
jgi:hypothetical protein